MEDRDDKIRQFREPVVAAIGILRGFMLNFAATDMRRRLLIGNVGLAGLQLTASQHLANALIGGLGYGFGHSTTPLKIP